MSSVFVQVGQCGNQIGQAFWDTAQLTEGLKPVYEHWDGYRRSVHVDSEPKVVKHLKDKNSAVRPENVISSKRGRGSNWALGYHGCRLDDEDRIAETALNCIRKEVERCSSFSGFVLLHSMSGGTGSGLGSRLCESLRDIYGLPYILSCVVAPHTTGESPIQYYNALLCLSMLQKTADGILLLSNDDVLSQVERRRKDRACSFQDMNSYIGSCLAGLFMPTDTLTSKSGKHSIGLEPWEIIRSVCPDPMMKFLHVSHLSRSKLTWDNLAGQMLQCVKRRNAQGVIYESSGNVFIARGDTTQSFGAYQHHIESKVKSAYSCVPWNPFPVDFWTARTTLGGPTKPASVTCIANSSLCVDSVQEVLDRSWQKFHAKAYLHHYYKHGCQQGDFEEAFEVLQQAVSKYEQAVT